MFLKWRLKIRNFFKKNKTKIFFILIVWVVILVINYLLGHKKEVPVLNTTYTPHDVLLKSEYDVPKELQNPIENLIDDYINKCNNKDFSEAFALLTEDCKKNVFEDSEQKFIEYASSIFKTKKRYSIQNYSNYGGKYIYNLKIIDDIITTGLTGQEYAYYEEKIAINEKEGNLQLCVNDYMGYEELKKVAEDDNIKIRVENRQTYYGYEIYTIRITNKTGKHLVLYDSLVGNELYLETGNENRMPSKVSATIALIPEETRTFQITFSKYYDEQTQDNSINFNKIRIMNNYTGEEQSEEEELTKSEKTYSMGVPIQ
ncbi:MAG: hypothetical protein HFJ44_02575 [Clostridia bacterium]|nr:hypothetical protein [Clostridia bacterium]